MIMHEFAIAQDITSSLQKSLGEDFKNLSKINIEIGCFSGIVADSLSFGLETLIGIEQGDSNLLIDIREKEANAKCECGHKYKVKKYV